MILREIVEADDGTWFHTEDECYKYEKHEMLIDAKTDKPVHVSFAVGDSWRSRFL